MHSKILPEYCTSGRRLNNPDGIIVHYFSAKNVDPDNRFDMNACRRLFLDLNRKKSEREFYMKERKWPEHRMYASAHVLIGRSGEVWRLVEYDRQAYHAGSSILNGRPDCNKWTVGVELVGALHSGFTEPQYIELAKIVKDFDLPIDQVAGHDQVRWNAIQAGAAHKYKYDPSGRKDGQGDNFKWMFLKTLVREL